MNIKELKMLASVISQGRWNRSAQFIKDEKGKIIAEAFRTNTTSNDQFTANGVAISMVPELIEAVVGLGEALERMVAYHEGFTQCSVDKPTAIQQAKEAIETLY